MFLHVSLMYFHTMHKPEVSDIQLYITKQLTILRKSFIKPLYFCQFSMSFMDLYISTISLMQVTTGCTAEKEVKEQISN